MHDGLFYNDYEDDDMYYIWMVTYRDQTESPYTWTTYTYGEAVELRDRLEKEYPERVWEIFEKDVS